MNNKMNNQDFQDLIKRYLDGEIVLDEVKKLFSYYESFQKNHDWLEELGPENIIKDKMLIKILETIQDVETKQTKIVPFYKKSIFKYAVAASVIFIISINVINNKQSVEKAIIVNEIIKPGTDKATLTLQDGTEVVLEKGTAYKNQNISSNGEKIIYKEDKSKSETITYNYLTISRGGQFFVKLSDGTQVWLNSESQLKYPTNFIDGQTRAVELVYGEAYFEVSHSTEHKGSKFKLVNNSQEIVVLGTKFNVKAYKDEKNIYTTLTEGKVVINTSEHNQVLIPGQQSNLNIANNDFKIINVDVKSEIAWVHGDFVFHGKSLRDIVKVLSRWYDIDFKFENSALAEEKFNGELGKNQNLEDILLLIKTTNKINSYEINNKLITLK
tara:strand:+ start:23941 stop:25092 length:1152 start_codon:yes stop_codon:yes gene_type:complete